MPIINQTKMIAQCGINCSVCIGYLREKNKCLGCNAEENENMHHCKVCSIKHCPEKNGKMVYCYECGKFPCQRMKQLDKRYRSRYNTSLINNLKEIEQIGIRKFVTQDGKKWICRYCGSTISIHRNACLTCGKEYVKERNFDDNRTSKVV